MMIDMGKDKVLGFIGIVFILIVLFTCFYGGYEYARSDNDLIKRPIPLQIAKNLNSETGYMVDRWDCSDMSRELVSRLRPQGYPDAEYIGVKLNGTCHAIVRYTAYIAATSGKSINPNIDADYSFDRTGCRSD